MIAHCAGNPDRGVICVEIFVSCTIFYYQTIQLRFAFSTEFIFVFCSWGVIRVLSMCASRPCGTQQSHANGRINHSVDADQHPHCQRLRSCCLLEI
jgi:hypothetical protein